MFGLRKLATAALIAAMVTAVNAAEYSEPTWVDLGTSKDGRPLAVDVTESTPFDIAFEVNIAGFYRQEVLTEEAGSFDRIWLPSGGRTAELGKPEVPTVGRWFAIPAGAQLSVEVISVETQVIRGYRIVPAQEPQMEEVENSAQLFQFDELFYERDTIYPAVWAEVSEPVNVRGVQMANLTVFPVRFNPKKGEIEVATHITVRVEFKGGGPFADWRLRSPFFEPFFRSYLANYEQLGPALLDRPKYINTGIWLDDPNNPDNMADLLIIVPDELVDSILPLALYHHQTGIITKIARLSQIGTNPTYQQIRQFIQNAYNTWAVPPSFVMLVGDAELVAVPYVTVHSYHDIHIGADIYYAEMDNIPSGQIPMPDLFVGRLTVDNSTQLGILVRKILKYMDDPAQPYDWLNSVLLAAYDESGRYFVWTSETIYNYLNPLGYNVDRQYEDGNPPGSTQGVINAINNGVFLANHRDHGDSRNDGGSFDGWGHPRFTTDHVPQLNNGDFTPVFFSLNCMSGWFDGETDENGGNYESLGEELLRKADGGAVAFLAMTRVSYSGYNDEIDRGLIDAIFPNYDPTYPNDTTTNQYQDPLPYLGGVLNYSKLWVYDKYVLPGGCPPYPWEPTQEHTLYEFEMFTLQGDPAMMMRTAVPESLVVTHVDTIPIGHSTIQVTVTDGHGNPVPDAIVSASFQDTLLIDRTLTDADGMASLDIMVTPVDSVNIFVTAYNYLVHKSFVIPVSDMPYVAYGGHLLHDDSGNGDGIANPDETIQMDILAINYGLEGANSVVATLQTEDPYATISQDLVAYGDFGPQDSMWSPQPFEFSVAHETPDMHRIPFDITFTDANDSSWTSRFFVQVYAPLVGFSGVLATDSVPGGTPNNVIEPGEFGLLSVALENRGHMDASNVIASISTSADYITILDTSVEFGDISVGDIAFGSTPFVIQVSPTAPSPVFPTIYLDIETDGGFHFVDSFKITVGLTGMAVYFEDDTAGWTHGGSNDMWHLTSYRTHSGAHAFFSGSEGGNYQNNMNAWLESPIVILGENSRLSFWTWYELESGYDYGIIEISTNNGSTWTEIGRVNGNSGGWTQVDINLSSYSAGTAVRFRFRHTTDGSVTREGWYIDDVVVTPPNPPANISVINFVLDDDPPYGNGSGVLDIGETAMLVPIIENTGGTQVIDLTATLHVDNPENLIVHDSVISYGTVAAGSQVTPTDSFFVEVPSNVQIGTVVHLTVEFEGDNGHFHDSFETELTIGDVRTLPVGPDSYGYYIYDPIDPFAYDFEWVELNPALGGPGSRMTMGNDQTQLLALPFDFTYYGETYNMISVCSNGWIAFGTEPSTAYLNYTLPNRMRPNNMVAIMWDDLDPSNGGAVFRWYDSTNHRFIIEWWNVPHRLQSNSNETFEVILFDPDYYPTSTGDGQIVLQYLHDYRHYSFTVGLENSTGTVGLTFFANNVYPSENAFPFRDSFALRITTEAIGIEENEVSKLPRRLEMFPAYPNPFRHTATISFALPKPMDVEVKIYDLSGRAVRKLLGGRLEAGVHSVEWDGRDDYGRTLPAGIYIYRLSTPTRKFTQKLILMR